MHRPAPGPRALTVGAAALGLVATALVSGLPGPRLVYRAPSLHIALETAVALVALLVAYLFYGRFRESGRLPDLVLTGALTLLAFTNLFFSAIPAAVNEAERGQFTTWAPLVGRLVGAALLAAAAFLPARRARRRRLAGVEMLAFGVVTLVAIGAPVALLGDHLPVGVDPDATPASGSRPELVGHLGVLGVQLAVMALHAAAAIGFTRRAERSDDELMRWLGIGSALAAVAALNFFLFPSLYSERVYSGDVFRLLHYLVLLVGAGREIGRYWRGLADAAVLEERRRMARDIHDGVAQELAFIVRHTKRLAGSDPAAAQIAAAAERGLTDSRRAIAALTRPLNEPIEVLLEHAVGDVAARAGVRLALDLEPGIEVGPAAREALVRIACEAVSNAARHGGASVVRVELSQSPDISLRIVDDGVGFDPKAVERREAGFGVRSMKERAGALGASFRLASRPGTGTEIEIVL